MEFTELVDPVRREPWASGDFTGPMEHSRGFCDMADGLRQEAAFGWHLLEARAAAGGGDLDAYSRAHLEETKARIEAALEAGLERNL